MLTHILGGLVQRYPRAWLGLGRLESSQLAQELVPLAVRMPIYVCGLARAGSTLLHEIVSAPAGVATHRVKDYPLIFTPYWWRRATASMRPTPPRPRAHGDGMMITTQSPDALEEMLWMAFFPNCHDPAVTSCMGRGDSHPAFESFYDLHLRKLMLAEGATRYAAKNNYHVARLPYLLRLFPDARFVLAVRAPAAHVASLRRQHLWFSQGQRKHPRSLAYMRRSGHFEFGLDRRPIHLGDERRVRRIQQAWAAGDEVRGLAMYWDMVYGYLADLLDSDAQVRSAAVVVRFETLCSAAAETLQAVLEHCRLPDDARVLARYAPDIHLPAYYSTGFTAQELEVIHTETAVTAKRWGIEPAT
ncbi:MAG TPA: sulfotransferase [Gemmataceae bacterium]|nr:sulfotransferase [Gemmataceae bacterium]